MGGGTSNKSVNLSGLGLKEISEAGRSTRVCAKLDDRGNLVGLTLGESGAGWWGIQRAGDEGGTRIEDGIEACNSEAQIGNKSTQSETRGTRSGDCQNDLRSQLNRMTGNKVEILKKLMECMKEKKEKLLSGRKSKLGWHRVGKGYEIPLDGILKVGTGWTWHQKQIKVN